MAEERDEGITIPQAKRTERERPDPGHEPAEFVDDDRVNRFEPPPDPPEKGDRRCQREWDSRETRSVIEATEFSTNASSQMSTYWARSQ